MLDEDRTCTDKIQYKRKAEAKAAVRSGIKEGYLPITASVYVCPFCTFYHRTSSRTLVPRKLSSSALK